MGITWAGHKFEGPTPLESWVHRSEPAIFVILHKEYNSDSKKYSLLYVAEVEDMADVNFREHEKYKCWLEQAQINKNLFIAIMWMPGSFYVDRRKIELEILERYKPPCN